MTAPDYDPAEDLTILANNYTLNPSRVERIRAHIAALRAENAALRADCDALRTTSTCTKCGWVGSPLWNLAGPTLHYFCPLCSYEVSRPLIAVEVANAAQAKRIGELEGMIETEHAQVTFCSRLECAVHHPPPVDPCDCGGDDCNEEER